MTVDEFQRQYHSYAVDTKAEALAEIERLEIVRGHFVVPVYLDPPGKWCIMLDTAATALRELGIIPTR